LGPEHRRNVAPRRTPPPPPPRLTPAPPRLPPAYSTPVFWPVSQSVVRRQSHYGVPKNHQIVTPALINFKAPDLAVLPPLPSSPPPSLEQIASLSVAGGATPTSAPAAAAKPATASATATAASATGKAAPAPAANGKAADKPPEKKTYAQQHGTALHCIALHRHSRERNAHVVRCGVW
jgi:hypothetical protein